VDAHTIIGDAYAMRSGSAPTDEMTRHRLASLILGLLPLACAHHATRVRGVRPVAVPVAWIDAPLLGSPPTEVEALAALAAAGDPHARQVRLDRLLDLYDAARFGQDQDARETLWAALGGHATGVGERASREATERLLQEALALDEAARRAGDEPVAAFAADAIMMLSTDLQPPGSAEDLSIRTLAYRTLVEGGHPRLGDNARWRLYDHVRGTLAGAVEAPPAVRLPIAVQALYAERDAVEDLLADAAPHARPPWPTADALWGLVEAERTALASEPRWAALVERRAGDDHALHETLRASLPAARRDDWPLWSLSAGTARAESLAPVAWIHEGQLRVDVGRTPARPLPIEADVVELAQALGTAIAQDGRGTLLLVADPGLPAPQLRAALRAVFRAHAERLELAVAEPRVDATAGPVVMALPLEVTHAGGPRAGDRAWAEARVHVHLDGRGPRLAVDGRWLSTAPTEARALRALVEQIARAYPRERGVVLSLGPDVQLQQLLDVLVALEGGPVRPFAAVGWMADGTRPREGGGDGDAWLARRLALSWVEPQVDVEQPYPLEGHDQPRLEGFAKGLAVCLPELGAERAPEKVALALRFEEGRLRHAALVDPPRGRPKAGVAAMIECVEDEGYALRLRGHREAIAVTVTLGAAPTKG
jgi:hypothetical protein